MLRRSAGVDRQSHKDRKLRYVTEPGWHRLLAPEDRWTIILATGYRSTVDALSPLNRERVRTASIDGVRRADIRRFVPMSCTLQADDKCTAASPLPATGYRAFDGLAFGKISLTDKVARKVIATTSLVARRVRGNRLVDKLAPDGFILNQCVQLFKLVRRRSHIFGTKPRHSYHERHSGSPRHGIVILESRHLVSS
jgi:hypothetical protein